MVFEPFSCTKMMRSQGRVRLELGEMTTRGGGGGGGGGSGAAAAAAVWKRNGQLPTREHKESSLHYTHTALNNALPSDNHAPHPPQAVSRQRHATPHSADNYLSHGRLMCAMALRRCVLLLIAAVLAICSRSTAQLTRRSCSGAIADVGSSCVALSTLDKRFVNRFSVAMYLR